MRDLIQRATPERPRFGVVHCPGRESAVWAVEILGLATVAFRHGTAQTVQSWCSRNDVIVLRTV